MAPSNISLVSYDSNEPDISSEAEPAVTETTVFDVEDAADITYDYAPGPDYSHYHVDGGKEHFSSRPGDNNPLGF